MGWISVMVLGTLALLWEGKLARGDKVVVLQDKAVPRGDLESFIDTQELIWTYRGTKALDKNITCKVDYNITKVNSTLYTFKRNFTINKEDKQSHEMQGRLLVTKSNPNIARGICSSWVVTDEANASTLEVMIYQTTNHSCAVFYILPLSGNSEEHGNVLLSEDDFFCEIRVKNSITSEPYTWPAKGEKIVANNKQPPQECLNAYTQFCTGRGKTGDAQVYYPSCKTSL